MQKVDHRNKHQKYICEDCSCIFTVWTVPTHRRRGVNRRPFCPNCGDFETTIKYVSDRVHGNPENNSHGVKWSAAEIELLDECIKGKYTPTQLSHMLGRSVRAVSTKKWDRIKKLKAADLNG